MKVPPVWQFESIVTDWLAAHLKHTTTSIYAHAGIEVLEEIGAAYLRIPHEPRTEQEERSRITLGFQHLGIQRPIHSNYGRFVDKCPRQSFEGRHGPRLGGTIRQCRPVLIRWVVQSKNSKASYATRHGVPNSQTGSSQSRKRLPQDMTSIRMPFDKPVVRRENYDI